jgi:hypothetical protein
VNRDQRRRQKRVLRSQKSWLGLAEAAIKRLPFHHADRCVLEALKRCNQGHARIYAGDHKLAGPVGKRDPRTGRKMRWTKGESNFCAPITIWRGKTRLERLHILQLVHTRGGYTRNPDGEVVRAATGYEAHPDLYVRLPAPRSEPSAKPAPVAMTAEMRQWALRAGREVPDGP